MCAIIGIKFKDVKQVTTPQFMKIVTQIRVKGNDEFGYAMIVKNNHIKSNYVVSETGIKSYNEFKELISNAFESLKYRGLISILVHSRATPEMEEEETSRPQPYVVYNNFDTPYVIAAHGTIPDYNEIVYSHIDNLAISRSKATIRKSEYIFQTAESLSVDTEYLSITKDLARDIINNTKGKLTTIALDLNTGDFDYSLMSNRLGLWKHDFNMNMIVYSNFNIKNKMTTVEPNVSGLKQASINSKQYSYFENHYREVSEIFVSFSGGMDIVASVMKYLNQMYYELPKHKIIERKIHLTLVYFDWGQVALKQEIKSMRLFKEYLIENFPEIQFHTKIIHVGEIFSLFGTLKLNDKSAKGDILETEQSVAYVNFRNSIFMNILAGYAEKLVVNKYNKAIPVDFIFGLNLSEGMIMSDNSYLWLENINKSIRCSGDYSQDFMVVAPFVHKTKTEIMQYLVNKPKLRQALELSFSCYYPDENGNACGKCGSCILREKAFLRNQQL